MLCQSPTYLVLLMWCQRRPHDECPERGELEDVFCHKAGAIVDVPNLIIVVDG
jgi:hypothetical protein